MTSTEAENNPKNHQADIHRVVAESLPGRCRVRVSRVTLLTRLGERVYAECQWCSGLKFVMIFLLPRIRISRFSRDSNQNTMVMCWRGQQGQGPRNSRPSGHAIPVLTNQQLYRVHATPTIPSPAVSSWMYCPDTRLTPLPQRCSHHKLLHPQAGRNRPQQWLSGWAEGIRVLWTGERMRCLDEDLDRRCRALFVGGLNGEDMRWHLSW